MTKLNQLQLISKLYLDDDDSLSDDEVASNLSDNLIKKEVINKIIEKDKCSICLSTSFKYKCPSCLVKTCSLTCFKKHKDQLECTGLKNSLKFKRLANFDDDQLRDDFKFLEDHDRQMNGIKRQKRNIVQSLNELPNWLKKLRYEANRRSINLKILPAGFKRRLENKTTFMYSSKEIFWDVEILFKNLNLKENDSMKSVKNPKKITFHIERVPETNKLKNLVEKYLKPDNLIDNLHLNSLLKHYQNANEDELAYLIKLSFNHYVKLDQESTINECLKNKTVIEFPTIIVILKKNLVDYNLVEEDDLRVKMREYANLSHELLVKNNLVRNNFKSRNKQNDNESSEEKVQESNKLNESEDKLDDCKDEVKDESGSEKEEGEASEVEEESSDDEPLETTTKFTFDNSFNDTFD